MLETLGALLSVLAVVIILAKIVTVIICYSKRRTRRDSSANLSDRRSGAVDMDKFLDKMEREKPIKFSSEQLWMATGNFNHMLGSGAFGAVYKGVFPNGVLVAVKVLRGNSDKRIEEQFMAEVSTIGRTHHFNLVRLYGFCFEDELQALVYEYMENGSLDSLLFNKKEKVDWEKLREIAIGTAKGINYLHQELSQRIIHYDIKPANILLDANYDPKLADFGLAKLCNRDNTHVTMTGGRGTPGYAAPELWNHYEVTYKCDVYSYGMLLFEIVGRRKNHDSGQPESQVWLPGWAWKAYEKGELRKMLEVCGVEMNYRERAERLVMAALWCVQFHPGLRPNMSTVVKMLEGGMEIPPPPNPFPFFPAGSPRADPVPISTLWDSPSSLKSSGLSSELSLACATPVMRRYEIEIASTLRGK